MKSVRVLPTSEVPQYRASTSGERLGWVILKSEESFRPVHRVLGDPELGPVIVVGHEVFEVDPEVDEVFVSDLQALDAYYSKEQQA